jgi:hypothetical protein
MNTTKIQNEIKNILKSSSLEEDELDDIVGQIIKKINSLKISKRKKDKNAPKNPQNAYMFYCNSNRSKFKEENPDMDAKTITRTIASKWNTMGTEDRAPYVKMAEKDKERYKQEMEKYKSGDEDTPPRKISKQPKEPKIVSKKTKKLKESSKTSEKKTPEKKTSEKKTPEKEVKESSKSKSEIPPQPKVRINPPKIQDEEDDDELSDEL